MTTSTLKPEVRDTLRATLLASLGTTMYQRLYVRDGKKKRDVMKKGELSCAFYVSSMLAMFGFMDKAHATVKTTETMLKKFGWKKTKTFTFGNVLIWDFTPDSDGHQHIGIYLGHQKAISNSSKKRVPTMHHYTYQGKRPVIRMYKNKKLEK